MLRLAAIASGLCLFSAQAATVGDTDRFIPLIHDGGGWSTELTIVNLSGKPASILATFLTAKGFLEDWNVELKASPGRVTRFSVESDLAPGASTVIETSGAPARLTRGFIDIIEYQDLPFGATARLIHRENGQIVESFTVALSPANESRSMLPLDLSDPASGVELVWVSPTNSTTLDLTFRNRAGEIALMDRITLGGNAQFFARPLDVWPQLSGFRGTLEWTVTFPDADRYEYRFLTGISLISRNAKAWAAVPAMTLPGDQRKPSPY